MAVDDCYKTRILLQAKVTFIKANLHNRQTPATV
jgi:hypothetical protein